MALWFPPKADVDDELKIYTKNTFAYYRVDFVEGMPPGSQGVIDFGAIAANGTITKTAQSLLQLDDGFLVQIRYRPLDDVELQLWQLGNSGRHYTKNWHARVTAFTARGNPDFSQTEFWVLGKDRDAQIAAINPRPTALARSRTEFWGWRYLVAPIDKLTKQPIPIIAEARNG
ncbi:MAG: hypothetical protein NTZ05_12380 [Chloroflexi bacterium]|nr:hypothetical protein [Chloroflexota bacterium]